MSQILHGIGVSPGAVAGHVVRLAAPPPEPSAETTVENPQLEADRAIAALADVANLLRERGAMVEVPAAALRAERLLRSCDFVSIGTNDLAQYTMAADRMEAALADLLDTWQPALLALL